MSDMVDYIFETEDDPLYHPQSPIKPQHEVDREKRLKMAHKIKPLIPNFTKEKNNAQK